MNSVTSGYEYRRMAKYVPDHRYLQHAIIPTRSIDYCIGSGVGVFGYGAPLPCCFTCLLSVSTFE